MQFFATAILAAATASAVSTYTVFDVSNFSAACIPHSVQCVYEFGLLQPGTMQTEPQQCRATGLVLPDGTLPNITDGTCQDTDRTFTVTRQADGSLVLTASQEVSPGSNQTASHTIPPSQLVMTQTGATRQQSYNGAKDFPLVAIDYS